MTQNMVPTAILLAKAPLRAGVIGEAGRKQETGPCPLGTADCTPPYSITRFAARAPVVVNVVARINAEKTKTMGR